MGYEGYAGWPDPAGRARGDVAGATFAGAPNFPGDPEDEPCGRCGRTYALHFSPDGQAGAECPPARVRPSRAVRDLLRVARGWSVEDDWGVRTLSYGSLADLADDLAAGDDPRALARHAKHTDQCERERCAILIPHNRGRS